MGQTTVLSTQDQAAVSGADTYIEYQYVELVDASVTLTDASTFTFNQDGNYLLTFQCYLCPDSLELFRGSATIHRQTGNQSFSAVCAAGPVMGYTTLNVSGIVRFFAGDVIRFSAWHDSRLAKVVLGSQANRVSWSSLP